jgi:hypothetical protein
LLAIRTLSSLTLLPDAIPDMIPNATLWTCPGRRLAPDDGKGSAKVNNPGLPRESNATVVGRA